VIRKSLFEKLAGTLRFLAESEFPWRLSCPNNGMDKPGTITSPDAKRTKRNGISLLHKDRFVIGSLKINRTIGGM
jgi:hypothetical protein